jgi:DNA repair exonuclease SbcCD nuclease subunit
MKKILHSADWHINLHKKKVPVEWQENRFKRMFEKLHALEDSCDIHIIAGDVFDRKPEPDEICLFLSYINCVSIPTYIIPGNHEATKKGETFLEHFLEDAVITNPNVRLFTKNKRIKEPGGLGIQFWPYGELQIDNLPEYIEGDILVGHIRGEVPPHITAEYDFEKLRKWGLILLGDIHFHHRYQDYGAWYSGSPINTHFDRDESKEYGVNIIEFIDSSNYAVKFLDLNLPKLIRKTIKIEEEMIPNDFHHVIYEVVGSIDELSKIKNSELLDKKVSYEPTEESKLDLKNMTTYEELKFYLEYLKVSDVEGVLKEFNELKVL